MYLRAREGIGYLPQEASIFRRLTVEENLLAVLELKGTDIDTAHQRAAGADRGVRAWATLRARPATRCPAARGGASRSRARSPLSRATCSSTSRSPASIRSRSASCSACVDRARRRRGLGVLITDHNVRETLQIVDRAYIISQGRIFRHGTPSELADDAEVRRVYLGENFRLN